MTPMRQLLIKRLQEINVCAEELEVILAQERKRLKARAAKVAAMPGSDGSFGDLFDDLADDWDRLDNTIPSVVRSALFARVVSEFEMILCYLAKQHIARHHLKFRLADLKGDGLRKVRLFFERFTDVGFPDVNELWEEITKLADLRNVVLHNEARISTEDIGGFEKFRGKWGKAILWDAGGKVTFGDAAVQVVVLSYMNFLREFFRNYPNA